MVFLWFSYPSYISSLPGAVMLQVQQRLTKTEAMVAMAAMAGNGQWRWYCQGFRSHIPIGIQPTTMGIFWACVVYDEHGSVSSMEMAGG